MRTTLNAIQSQIAALVDQDENPANISATDYSLRLSYINRSLMEWSDYAVEYGHRSVFKEYNVLVSTSTGNASIALPQDFRKPASFPEITYDGATTNQFPYVTPEDDGQYAPTDKRVWFLGNPNSGYILRIFSTALVSGASVKVPYYLSAQSLASPADIAEIPNPEYLVQRSVALLWEAREDNRFPVAQTKADRTLANLLEFEAIPHKGEDNRVKTTEETRYGGFSWGED